ncbi:hypothetical protein B5P43_22950 [Bacillus sp. SRB_336]|nr:hypothetical protein B5P43_22950 [Bacillus sp. SRB_336]
MRRPRPLPLHLANIPFTVERARESGVSRGRSRASDLVSMGRGLRVPKSAEFQLVDSCRALTAATPGSVISHLTAAKLHGLFLSARLNDLPQLDLAQQLGTGRPRRRNVHGRELKLGQGDVMVIAGVPTISVQRTLVDIAPLLTVDELVVVADQIVCAHSGRCVPLKRALVELNELAAYVAQHAGQRGMRKLKAAMELVQVGSDSPPETHLRLLIGRSPLPTFRHNIELKDARGLPKIQPDLSCEQYRTCAEYEGLHHFSPEQQSKDHERNFVTKSIGWNQVLINKADMRAGERVVITKIARMLKLGGWQDPMNLAGRTFG